MNSMVIRSYLLNLNDDWDRKKMSTHVIRIALYIYHDNGLAIIQKVIC
jgi:hypothetical protein